MDSDAASGVGFGLKSSTNRENDAVDGGVSRSGTGRIGRRPLGFTKLCF